MASDKIGKALASYDPKEVKEVPVVRSFIVDITARHQEAVSNQDFLGVLEKPVSPPATLALGGSVTIGEKSA